MASGAAASPSDGISGGYTGDSLGLKIVMAMFIGIGWYNAVELLVLIFVTFKQFRGLYFWCLLVSAMGVIPYGLGFLLKYFQLTSATWLTVTLLTIGWYTMVTGQSMVLYSRLHLVVQNPKILRRVLYMILIDAVLLHIPTTVLTYGSNFDPGNDHFINGYNVMERIQMTGFCIQEFIISGVYIHETVGLLKVDPEPGSRRIMYQLLVLNLLIILMDVGLLVTEYMNFYIVETTLEGTIYSIKLKLEFAVLGKLVNIVRNHSWKPEPVNGNVIDGHCSVELPDFVDATRVTSDVTHATSPSQPRQPPWMDPYEVLIAKFEHSNWGSDRGTGPSTASGKGSGDTRLDRLEALDSIDMTRASISPTDTTDHPG